MQEEPQINEQLLHNILAAQKQKIEEYEKTIADFRKAETALKEKAKFIHSLVDHMLDGMVICDWDGRILFANESAAAMVGLDSVQDSIGKNVADFFHPESKNFVLRDLSFVKDGKGGFLKEYRIQPLSGADVWVEAIGNRIQYNGGFADLVTFRNVSNRKRAESALRESENKYRSLIEKANEGIFIAQDGFIKFPNPRTIQALGYTEKELAEIPFAKLIHPDDRDAVIERHVRRLKGEEFPGPYTYRVITKSGEEIWILLNSATLTWEGRPATFNLVTDITHEKKLEKQFQAAQKMEAIGTLAGGIAHNFNNLLMGIQGHASLALFDMKSSDAHYEDLKAIKEQVKSGANLTNQLLGFARKGKYEVKPADLNDIIQKSSGLFERTQKGIRIQRYFQKGLWPAKVDKGQIEQALLNLYINAWQAMPRGGDLYLRTENINLDLAYRKPFYVKPGKYVKISIRDTGVGMNKETQRRLFEPFFTTKELGRGSGLGLASVYGIVKNHGGHVTVYSELGQGAAFNLYLPASEKEVVREKAAVGGPLWGKETVLLVDDEETILKVVEKALKITGYNPLTAKGGEEAIEIYRKSQKQISLVVLDMIMLGMPGGRVYDQLKSLNPDVKVILSSGYSLDGEASKIMARGCNAFIQKPFGILDLSKKIREVLDGNNPGILKNT